MQVRLEVAHAKANHKKVILKRDTLIGRSAECNLRIASKEVSRKHCQISLSDGGVTVRDLGSSNGTFVNGYKLDADTDYTVAPDSELSVGGVKFVVRYAAPAGLGSTVDLKNHATETEDVTESEATAAAALGASMAAAAATDAEAKEAAPAGEEETVLTDKEEPLFAEEEPIFAADEPIFATEDEPEPQAAATASAAEPVGLADDEDEPLLFEDEPAAAESVAEDEPILAEDEPILAEDEPIFAEDEPILAEDEPILAEDEPVLVEDEPILAEDEPIFAEDEPIFAADEPEAEPVLFEDITEPGVDDSAELEESLEDVPLLVDEQPDEAPVSDPLITAGDETLEALDGPAVAEVESEEDQDWLAFDDEPAGADDSADLVAESPTAPAAEADEQAAAAPLAEDVSAGDEATAPAAAEGEGDDWGFAAPEEPPADTSEDDAFAFLTEDDGGTDDKADDQGELGDFLKSLGDK